MESAIQNLEYIRQLIDAVRQYESMDDMERLRMIYGTGVGTDAVADQQEGR
jgi:hypothetical protein